MNKAGQLHADYKKALAELQEACFHSEFTQFMNEGYDAAHLTGRMVQLCADCNKVIHFRTSCRNCLELVYDDDGYRGDGKRHSYGTPFCTKACADEYQALGKKHGYSTGLSKIDICRHCNKKFPRDFVVRKGWAGLCSDECADAFVKKYGKR